MKTHGLVLEEGSKFTNLTVASGTVFPANPTLGEMFYRTDVKSIYFYSGTEWSLGVQDLSAGSVSVTGWRDITAEIMQRPTGSTAPVFTQMGTSPFWGWAFSLNKESFASFHMNHDYKPGGAVHLHVHWTSSGTSTNTVKWRLQYAVAKGHNQTTGGAFPLATSPFYTGQVDIEQAASGTPWRHMVTEMPTSIDVTNVEPDAIIMVRMIRITNGGTDNPDTVFGLTMDCHYQADRVFTINKAPNFYA